MLYSLLIFFVLAELFFLTKASIFWLIVILIFVYFALRRSVSAEFKNFFVLATPLLFLGLILILQRIYQFNFWPWHLYLLLVLVVFYFLLHFYRRSDRQSYFFQIFPLVAAALVSFVFFRSNIFENFLWKELLMFGGAFLILEGDRKITKPEANSLFSWVGALVFLELGWLLNFLPINFLSLAGIWLAAFYLTREFILLIYRNSFTWRLFLTQAFLVLILMALIVFSSSWQLI